MKNQFLWTLIDFLMPMVGVEPTAFRLQGERINHFAT